MWAIRRLFQSLKSYLKAMPDFDPNLFGVRCGADFPKVFYEGLIGRFGERQPLDFAQIEVFVNTRRMQRRLVDMFDSGPARLLPRIKLLSDVGEVQALSIDTQIIPPLRRRMELIQLIARLLEQQPDLASKDSVFDLADSVATLMDEMQGEGVDPTVFDTLDVVDESGHWRRSLEFLKIAQTFFNHTDGIDPEALQRRKVEKVIAEWLRNPPCQPIIIAGSTGSRGTTRMLMEAVAKLENGYVVLPGFDFDQPDYVWDQFKAQNVSQDHPQFRFSDLAQRLNIDPTNVLNWHDDCQKSSMRSRLISLALRPAPVTDQWMVEGPKLQSLSDATKDISLIEAQSPRHEALAIALKMRESVEIGETIALITPDRNLSRQVTAALDNWGIVPDDSAGIPLALTAAGRFLLQTADLMGRDVRFEDLLALLKHPICNTGTDTRGPHLRMTREYELYTRRYGPPFPDGTSLATWAELQKDEYALPWMEWILEGLRLIETDFQNNLGTFLQLHLKIAAHFAQGPMATNSGNLWKEKPGQEANRLIDLLTKEANSAGVVGLDDYRSILRSVLNKGEVRDRDAGHPNVLIWGTLEARVQGAETVILAGMNEGTWPEATTPDPWLNRSLRKQAGLLLPDRQIGLSAHDFQQAICAPKVLVTRSVRNSESETVPSRWINRLVNLLNGLPDTGGRDAVVAMKDRGSKWLAKVDAFEKIDSQINPYLRPSPIPPLSARPRKLSVTKFKTLVRDPYAIYADYILRLRPLDPIRMDANAPLRGIVMHKILERFVSELPDKNTDPYGHLLAIGEEEFSKQVPWPVVQRIWMAKLKSIAHYFLTTEHERQEVASRSHLEVTGLLEFSNLNFTVSGTADRIDLDADGNAWLYDYKTGVVPSGPVQKAFDRQLLIEAAMVEEGAFKDLGPREIKAADYLGLGATPRKTPAPLKDIPITQVLSDLKDLIVAFDQPTQGYTSRAKMQKDADLGYYDHLARFGEWSSTDEADRIVLK